MTSHVGRDWLQMIAFWSGEYYMAWRSCVIYRRVDLLVGSIFKIPQDQLILRREDPELAQLVLSRGCVADQGQECQQEPPHVSPPALTQLSPRLSLSSLPHHNILPSPGFSTEKNFSRRTISWCLPNWDNLYLWTIINTVFSLWSEPVLAAVRLVGSGWAV